MKRPPPRKLAATRLDEETLLAVSLDSAPADNALLEALVSLEKAEGVEDVRA